MLVCLWGADPLVRTESAQSDSSGFAEADLVDPLVTVEPDWEGLKVSD